jgi:hypothetical protein
MPFQSPARTAVLIVSDLFLYTAWSMTVMALVAVTQWHALAVDARDASNLGPLPISHWTIVRAKLSAVCLFAAAFAVALNVVPIVLHPVLVAATQPVGWSVVFMLTAAHASAVLAAAVFGFLVIVGFRELLRLGLGQPLFDRFSVAVQAALLLALGALFLVIPSLAADAAGRWLATNSVPDFLRPLFWFVGLHQLLAGRAIDRLPLGELPGRTRQWEADAQAVYQMQRPILVDLGQTAIVAATLVAALTFAAYAWNSRTLPAPLGGRRVTARRPFRAALIWMVRHTIVRHPVSQAGFFFTLQVLSRSVPHRLAVAAWLAIGVAISTAILRGVGGGDAAAIGSAPLGLLAIQTLLLMTLLMGIRHAIRVPAELPANWLFHLAFTGDERPYLAGVKRAALLCIIGPLLATAFLMTTIFLAADAALLHAAWGALVAVVLLEGVMLGFRKLAFASAYVPTGEMKYLGPPLALLALGVAYSLAWIERVAFTHDGTILLFAIFAIIAMSVHGLDVWRRRVRDAIELDEAPAEATQRFSLSE